MDTTPELLTLDQARAFFRKDRFASGSGMTIEDATPGFARIRLLLTEVWLPCVPFLRIFCLFYALYPIHTANLNAIKAVGRSDIFLYLEILKKLVDTAVLFITVPMGPLAMALGQLGAGLVNLGINAFPNRRLLNYRFRDQLRDLAPALGLAALMAACVWPLSLLGLGDLATLALQIPVGVGVYVLGSLLFKADSFGYLLDLVRRKRGK